MTMPAARPSNPSLEEFGVLSPLRWAASVQKDCFFRASEPKNLLKGKDLGKNKPKNELLFNNQKRAIQPIFEPFSRQEDHYFNPKHQV